MIKIGIIGGAGYTAGELCRILLNHPEAEIVFVNSTKYAGLLLNEVHGGLFGETDLRFTDELPFEEADVIFFCLEHGQSSRFLAEHYIPADVHLIDLAQDFRKAGEDNDYAYGLPELNRSQIINALHVANPGNFATCIQLGLLPLAESGLLKGNISINALIGATGLDGLSTCPTDFSWRSGNLSVFDAFEHDQLPEIEQSILQLQPDFSGNIDFIPYRGDFSRGLFATIVMECETSIEEIEGYYWDFYSEASFTRYIDRPIDMKQAVNTNQCLIHAEKHGHKLLVTVCMDNLLKGASGQAVQNMNLMFGLEETTGLRLKASAY